MCLWTVLLVLSDHTMQLPVRIQMITLTNKDPKNSR